MKEKLLYSVIWLKWINLFCIAYAIVMVLFGILAVKRSNGSIFIVKTKKQRGENISLIVKYNDSELLYEYS